MSWRSSIARILAPEEFARIEKRNRDLDVEVNQRVADILFKMDPFEPLMRKYPIAFWDKTPEQIQTMHVEDRLDEPSRIRLFMWAYGTRNDPNFEYLINWIRNRQGNLTLGKAQKDEEWFFGRAIISTVNLLVREVGRLSSHYEEILARKKGESLAVIE